MLTGDAPEREDTGLGRSIHEKNGGGLNPKNLPKRWTFYTDKNEQGDIYCS